MDSKLFERLTKPEKDKTVKSKELWSIYQLAIQGTLESESLLITPILLVFLYNVAKSIAPKSIQLLGGGR